LGPKSLLTLYLGKGAHLRPSLDDLLTSAHAEVEEEEEEEEAVVKVPFLTLFSLSLTFRQDKLERLSSAKF
jgi:hypothetical protein